MGSQRTQRGPGIGLVFFAPETATEPRYFHFYLVHWQACHPARCPLYCCWPLGGGINLKRPVFLRDCIGPLGLNVKVFLPVCICHPFKYIITLLPGRIYIAKSESSWRHDEFPFCFCFPRVGYHR